MCELGLWLSICIKGEGTLPGFGERLASRLADWQNEDQGEIKE